MQDDTPTPVETHQESFKTNGGRTYTLGVLCHLLTFCGYLVPFGNIIAPLVLWRLKRADDPFVDVCGKEALNFQLSITLYTTLCLITFLVGIGLLLLPIVMILNLIFTIIAAFKASEGQSYRYPLTLRLIK